MNKIAIIDYKAGNAPSVMHAVSRLGRGRDAVFARAAGDLGGATHIVLPGVGSAGATMQSLSEMGVVPALEDAVLRGKALFLGICVGLQVLFDRSDEDGGVDCLGWLGGGVERFDGAEVRVPQMGWNRVRFAQRAPVDTQEDYFYFVNSYRAKPEDGSVVWGEADYGGPFAAAVHKGNIYATQFHIEKSGEAGLALLGGFLNLNGGD